MSRPFLVKTLPLVLAACGGTGAPGFYIKAGLLKEKRDLSKLVDSSFAEAAAKALGPYKS